VLNHFQNGHQRPVIVIYHKGAALGFDAVAALSNVMEGGLVVLNFWANMVYGTAS